MKTECRTFTIILLMNKFDKLMQKNIHDKNWLGREGLYFIQTPTDGEEKAHRTVEDVFSICSNKFKLQQFVSQILQTK